jgi:glycyl-tRNA synthetase beta chain
MKCDLATNMVVEFTSLEGLVGSLYAKHHGVDNEIAEAIFEQRLHRRSGDSLPKGILGAAAGLIDRLDSLTGYAGLGLSPTGSRDPLGMRRLAIGVLSLLRAFGLDISIGAWVAMAYDGYGDVLERDSESTVSELVTFIGERMAQSARENGAKADYVQAVLVHRDRPLVFEACLRAIEEADESVLQELAEHTKRMTRIADRPSSSVDVELFEHDEERVLHTLAVELEKNIDDAVRARDFNTALELCLRFVTPIKKFFDEVMVNDRREYVRANRHALLVMVWRLIARVCNFSAIEKKSHRKEKG